MGLVDYQENFLEFAIKHGVLKFGEFTLKSGRMSPYFFNMGELSTGDLVKEMSGYYAEALMASCLEFDVMLGPAYKGIPLVTATALALSDRGMNKPFCFNRKEVKDHGEGGQIVGAALVGGVLIIDDVITAGTAIRESMTIIQDHKAKPAGILVAIDRQEKGKGDTSAIQEIKDQYDIPVISIINLDAIKAYLAKTGETENFKKIEAYQAEFGA